MRIAGWKYYINLRLHFYVGASISDWESSNTYSNDGSKSGYGNNRNMGKKLKEGSME